MKKDMRIFVEIAYPCWWAINGTAAAALSMLRLIIAGRLRIGLVSALPAHCVLGNRSAESRTGSHPRVLAPTIIVITKNGHRLMTVFRYGGVSRAVAELLLSK